MTPVRYSALHDVHLRLGAQMIEDAGWQRSWAFGARPEDEAEQVRRSVGVLDLSSVGKVALKGSPAGIDGLLADTWSHVSLQPLHAWRSAPGGPTVCRLTDDEALVLTTPAARETTFAQLHERTPPECVHVLDLTSGQAGLRLVGPRVREVLRVCTALDIRASVFTNLMLGQAAFARVPALILRDDIADLPAFSIFFSRDYAQHVWEWLVEVGRTYGLAPFGLGALQALESVTT